MNRYSYKLTFTAEDTRFVGRWEILDHQANGDYKAKYKSDYDLFGKVIWTLPHKEDHWELEEPPLELRMEYERLLATEPKSEPNPCFNAVELFGSEFNQRCEFGALVEHHAVYCHNQEWLYAPRKCKRTWATEGRIRDEDCPGYKPNPGFTPP